MQARKYFPLGIASGAAFCNRQEQTRILLDNIQSGRHSLLIATRRFGKSSLALHTIKLSKLPFVELDFYMARDEKVVAQYIINGVIQTIGKALGPIDKCIASIKKYAKTLKPKLDISTPIMSLELIPDINEDPATHVKDALQLLEKLLAEHQQRAVILMDEFQSVGIIAKGSGIEAAIRHVAQKTQWLSIIFSGSNRRLLQIMFEDKNRPLYKLCWKISLQKIAAPHYEKHLKKVSQAAWGEKISDGLITLILSLSQSHPYYVNKLCDRIFSYYPDKTPTPKAIETLWNNILEEERSDAIRDISTLSAKQKSVLLHIAKGNPNKLTSKDSVLSLEMTPSTITTALDALEEKDFIEKNNNRYSIISPIITFYVLKDEIP